MTDQEPQIRPRRGPRPRLNPTPPLRESQVSLQDQEELKSKMEVIKKIDVLLERAIDEDKITGLRTPDTYPKQYFPTDKHIKLQRDRGASRERSLAREEALDQAYSKIGRSMTQMLRDHNFAAVKYYLSGISPAAMSDPRKINVEAYTFPADLDSARREEILQLLEQEPKDFFNVWQEIPEGKKEKIDVDMNILDQLRSSAPRILQEPRYIPSHGYQHHVEPNILFDNLKRFMSGKVLESFFAGSGITQATPQE